MNQPFIWLQKRPGDGRPGIIFVFLFPFVVHDNYVTSIQMCHASLLRRSIYSRDSITAQQTIWRIFMVFAEIRDDHDSLRWFCGEINRTCQPRWNLSSWPDVVLSERCSNKCKGITLLRRPGRCGWSRRKSRKRWPTLVAEKDLEIRDKSDRSLREATDIFMRHRCATRKIYVQEVSVEDWDKCRLCWCISCTYYIRIRDTLLCDLYKLLYFFMSSQLKRIEELTYK